jgi:PAS domain S-box-containing protein
VAVPPDASVVDAHRGLSEVSAESLQHQIEIQTVLLDQVQDAILTVDREFKITYCNGAWERLFGWSSQEAIGQPYGHVAGTVVSQEDRAAIHREILGRGSWNGEIICTNRAGAQFVVHVSWSVIRDSSGNVQCIMGIHRDMTAPKQMEQRLRATEDRLRLAQDTLGVGTWEGDFGSGMPKCSDQLLRLYGFQGNAGAFTFEDWLNCVHPEDRARMSAAAAELRTRREAFVAQFRVVWPDGSVHWILDRSQVALDEGGRPARIIGVSVDITEQKVVESASAQLAAIVECADASIISTSLDGEVLTWNRGAERLHGYTADEMLGRSVSVLVPADGVEEWEAIQEKLRRGESVNHAEMTRLTKSGDRIEVLLTISPIWDRNGAVQGTAGVGFEITQVKQLERQLAQTQKLESIGQLAAGIAHEINTPIQYIGDNAKFLEDAFRDMVKFATARGESKDSPGSEVSELGDFKQETLDEGVFEYLRDEVPKAIEQLLEGVDHVARIVRAMKEFSHPGQVEKAAVDINHAIESTILVSKNEWKYVADVTTDLDRELPPVACLAGEFNQVILNLIVNAAHAIADANQETGGRGAIHISTRKAGPCVEIRVKDTGCGIPKAIQSKVFDPFFTTKPVGKGTGQGLAIAHSVIVQKHNGSIQLESEPGSGTTFVIRLPLECELEAA